MSTTITAVEARILGGYGRRTKPQALATANGVTLKQAEDIFERLAGGDPATAAKLAREYDDNHPAGAPPVRTNAMKPGPVKSTPAPLGNGSDSVDALLALAATAYRPETRALVDKVNALLAEIRKDMSDDTMQRDVDERVRVAWNAHADRLQGAIAGYRKVLDGGPNRMIRRWAMNAGIDCPGLESAPVPWQVAAKWLESGDASTT